MESSEQVSKNNRGSMVMPWIYLAIAVVCEVVWAITLKDTYGFTRLEPTVINLIALTVNLYFIAAAIKSLPVSIAYPIWTGVGGIGVVLCAVVLYHESIKPMQLFFIFLVIVGTVGLKLSESKPQEDIEGEIQEEIDLKLTQLHLPEDNREATDLKLTQGRSQEEALEAIEIDKISQL